MADYTDVKQDTLQLIEQDWGQRCETPDYIEFPELKGKTDIMEGRCPVCVVYERFDKFWEVYDDPED